MTERATPIDRKRILIVEDDEDECALMLEHFGHHFEIEGFADNYDNLLSKLQPGRLPQIILANLSLPRKNGLEIVQELKKDKKYQQIPVILIAASFPEFVIRQAMQLGASACIEKPVVYTGYSSFCNSIYDLVQGASL
jgi:CheY-like chemotaxis protein